MEKMKRIPFGHYGFGSGLHEYHRFHRKEKRNAEAYHSSWMWISATGARHRVLAPGIAKNGGSLRFATRTPAFAQRTC